MLDLWLPRAWTAPSQLTVNAWLMRATQAHPNPIDFKVQWAADGAEMPLGTFPSPILLPHLPLLSAPPPPPPTHDLDSISCFQALSELHRLVTAIISREEEAGTGWRPD